MFVNDGETRWWSGILDDEGRPRGRGDAGSPVFRTRGKGNDMQHFFPKMHEDPISVWEYRAFMHFFREISGKYVHQSDREAETPSKRPRNRYHEHPFIFAPTQERLAGFQRWQS